MRPTLTFATWLSLTACGCSSHARILVVPAGLDDRGLTDSQLREQLFRRPDAMFLARQAGGGLTQVQHYRVKHSTTSTYIPERVGMSEPLALSSYLIVDRATLGADDLVLCLRPAPDAPWRYMVLDRARLDDAAEAGRLHLLKIENLPMLR